MYRAQVKEVCCVRIQQNGHKIYALHLPQTVVATRVYETMVKWSCKYHSEE